jgi:multicomponent Na+:H+ antiporter subunit D
VTAHLPVLQVGVPLVCAPICVLLRSRTGAWLVFLLAAVGSLACAVLLATRVADGGTQRYAVGG